MGERTSILWFRNDLRLHDNEALSTAIAESEYVLPVYCFDLEDYGKTHVGIDRTGPARACFILECVAKLRESLRARGLDLVVKIGRPEEVLLDLAVSIGADAVYAHQEVSQEDIQVENKVAASLKGVGVEVNFFWGGTLIHIDDLPFELEQMPPNYCGFRQAVQQLELRQPLEVPEKFSALPVGGEVKTGDIPTLEDLGLEPFPEQLQDDEAGNGPPFIGGEEEAFESLKNLILDSPEWSSGEVGKLDCGDGVHGTNFCSKLSPWLAIGCLSPRRMFEELKKLRRLNPISVGGVACENLLNSLLFELLWRDFFRFITKVYVSSKRSADATEVTLQMKGSSHIE